MTERIARILADYAMEVRKLAYILPSGVGQTEALRLSEDMARDAHLWHHRSPAAVRRPDPLTIPNPNFCLGG